MIRKARKRKSKNIERYCYESFVEGIFPETENFNEGEENRENSNEIDYIGMPLETHFFDGCESEENYPRSPEAIKLALLHYAKEQGFRNYEEIRKEKMKKRNMNWETLRRIIKNALLQKKSLVKKI